MALIEETIRVDAQLTPTGELRREFGRGLFLHRVTAAVSDRGESELIRSVRSYATIRALESDSPGAAILAAGRAWFAAEPHPRNLLVGTNIAAAQPSYVFGGDTGTVAEIEALGNNVALNLGGNDFMADFDSLTTFATIAAALQTGIRTVTAYSAVTVAHNGEAFVITGGTGYDFGDGFADSTASRTLGLAGTGVSVLDNVATAESPADSLTRIESLDASFFWIGLSTQFNTFALIDPIRDWVAARRLSYALIVDVFGTDILVANETTSIGAQISAQGGDGIAAIFNGKTPGAVDHMGLRYGARFSSVNFDQPGSDINGKFLTLSGATATPLTSSERAELDRKRINWYVSAGAASVTGEGVSFGTWLDVYYFLSWFADALRIAGWNHLRSAAGSGGTPLTDQGLAALSDSLEDVCEQAVRFGAIAPNTVSAVTRQAIQQATGNPEFDGLLSTGYLIVRPTAAELSQTVRNNRGPVPIKIYAKGSGKVNDLDIALTLEN